MAVGPKRRLARVRGIGQIINRLKHKRAEEGLLVRRNNESGFESASNKRMQWSAASEFCMVL